MGSKLTIIPFKVFIYWNLHKNCWSVKALTGRNRGKVILHVSSFYMADVTYKVSEAGRQRVLREGRKNVHAGVVGKFISYKLADSSSSFNPFPPLPSSISKIRYNPNLSDTFFNAETGASIYNSANCCGTENREILAWN